MADRLRRTVTLALLGALSALACTSQEKLQETQLTELLGWLPGTYDGRAPTTVQSGVIMPHGAITLVVAKVYAPRLGHHVFYAQEMAADDPLRVLSQRMFSFKVDEKRGILETVYTFVEPLRWRDGQQNIVLFTAVQPDDLKSVPGCELLWKKGAGRFYAATDPKHCKDSGPAGSATGEVTLESLTLSGYEYRKNHEPR
jgi:hypothetical protein